MAHKLPSREGLEIIYSENVENKGIPQLASRKAIEMYDEYDYVCYIEDDIAINDLEFFEKLNTIHKNIPEEFAVMPHRCERIDGKGYVILSGDPDGGRKDLFWDTGEHIRLKWADNYKTFYRATNPHSGCYFLSSKQAKRVFNYWNPREWSSNFQLAGPLEQAASGMLLPTLKIMKPIKDDFKFLMVEHQDELWKRHEFED